MKYNRNYVGPFYIHHHHRHHPRFYVHLQKLEQQTLQLKTVKNSANKNAKHVIKAV